MKLASAGLTGVLVALAATARLLAHDPGLSALDVRIGDREIVAVLTLAAADARSVGNGAAFSALVRDSLELWLDGRRLPALATSCWSDETGGVHSQITYERPGGNALVVRSSIVKRMARGHRELLSIRTDNGTMLSERMLDSESSETTADISTVTVRFGRSFWQFFRLGVRHILTGYDHLLFLAGVLVVLRKWRDVFQAVTAFTLAHSITLALATTGVVLIPARIVEPLIAASIVFVGVENLVKREPVSRWKLTFGFGLVHGLGFATALRDLGVGAGGHTAIALPLASFNLGVEAGQMAVACLVVPLFWWLSTPSTSRLRFASAWSVLVIGAGSYWFVERIL